MARVEYPNYPRVNVKVELTYLRAGTDPPWERIWRAGKDITDTPDLWLPAERTRRLEYEERVTRYRADGYL